MKRETIKKFVFSIVLTCCFAAAVFVAAQLASRSPAPNKTVIAAADLFAVPPSAAPNNNYAALAAQNSNQNPNADAEANAIDDLTPKSVAGFTNDSAAAIARLNTDYKFNLTWAFGGKAQRGWFLYESLINETIKHDPALGDIGFAAALRDWQAKVGIEPNGVLDEATFGAMIKFWQTNRLKARGYPSPDELLTAPAADFWDQSREADLRLVERETYAAYKRMIRAACADKSLKLQVDANGDLAAGEKFLKIVSAFRSKEHQARLRAASPNSGRAGLAVNSPHFTGRALDIFVGGEPVETRDQNRAVQVNSLVYRWLVKNAAKFDFKPYFYEPWHWEYAPAENPSAQPPANPKN